MKKLIVFLATVTVLNSGVTSPIAAQPKAQQSWLVLPFDSSSTELQDISNTFAAVIEAELNGLNVVVETKGDRECSERSCAISIARHKGASFVVLGSLNQLGKKIVVIAMKVNVATDKVQATERVTVTSVEDLEEAAKKIALTLESGKSTDDVAELGNITEVDAEPERRRAHSRFKACSRSTWIR